MAQQGEIVQWNDERGFGFIKGANGQRHFVHISAIGRIATRPREGDRVTFTPGTGRDGRPQARSVRILGANPVGQKIMRSAPEHVSPWDWRIFVALILLGLLGAGLLLERVPWPLVIAYLAMSTVSFVAYRADKQSAQTGAWRISEVRLLGYDLCLGIIGGLLGQALYRHKTRKADFIASTVLITAVHALWLGGLASGYIGAEILVQEITGAFSSFG